MGMLHTYIQCKFNNFGNKETIKGDLVEIFEIFKGFDDLDPNIIFELSQAHTRGYSLKLIKPICRLDTRKLSFEHRVNDVWKSLDKCDSINGFKNRIHKCLHGQGFISF